MIFNFIIQLKTITINQQVNNYRNQCKVCKKKFYGRIDKLFCSVKCKNFYHRNLRKATSIAVLDINNILERNRSIRKDFKLKLLHENWIKYKGNSSKKRIIWSFIGGFMLIFGARIAGACTSGHILSGGMQLALSSLTFAVFVFAGLLVTGQLFYKGLKKQFQVFCQILNIG